MSVNTTNLGRQAETGVLIANEVRTGAMILPTLTVTGNINAGSETVAGNLFANALGVTTSIASATISTTGLITSGAGLNVTGQVNSTSINTGSITATGLSAGVVTGTSQMLSPSFTQPDQALGSAASPAVTTSQVYSSAFTKYIFYFNVVNNAQFNQTFTLTSFPDGFFATKSAVYDATFVATGTCTGGSVPITTADLYASETDNTLSVNVLTPIAQPPQFTGTCYIKVVISFTND